VGRFCYQVVGRQQGWAYRLGETYSRIFPSQFEAIAAAKAAAVKMHEDGDETLVRVQDSALAWRTELTINDMRGFLKGRCSSRRWAPAISRRS